MDFTKWFSFRKRNLIFSTSRGDSSSRIGKKIVVVLKKSFFIKIKKNMAIKKQLIFPIWGGLTLRIFLRSKWLLDLPDLDFFNGKK